MLWANSFPKIRVRTLKVVLLWLRSVRFCFLKTGKKGEKKSAEFRPKFFFSHNYVWIAHKYVCDFVLICFKICLISFHFVYISFWQLYTRKPHSINVQLHKSAHIYALSRLLLRLTTLKGMKSLPTFGFGKNGGPWRGPSVVRGVGAAKLLQILNSLCLTSDSQDSCEMKSLMLRLLYPSAQKVSSSTSLKFGTKLAHLLGLFPCSTTFI